MRIVISGVRSLIAQRDADDVALVMTPGGTCLLDRLDRWLHTLYGVCLEAGARLQLRPFVNQ